MRRDSSHPPTDSSSLLAKRHRTATRTVDGIRRAVLAESGRRLSCPLHPGHTAPNLARQIFNRNIVERAVMVNADIRQHHDVLPQKIVFPCQSIVRKVTQRVAEHRDQRPFQPQLQAECRATWRPPSIDFAPSSAIDRKPHWKTPPSQETSEPPGPQCCCPRIEFDMARHQRDRRERHFADPSAVPLHTMIPDETM